MLGRTLDLLGEREKALGQYREGMQRAVEMKLPPIQQRRPDDRRLERPPRRRQACRRTEACTIQSPP